MGRPSTEKPASNFATAQADTKPNARLATRILRQSYSLRIKERTAHKKNEVANLREPFCAPLHFFGPRLFRRRERIVDSLVTGALRPCDCVVRHRHSGVSPLVASVL